MAAVLLTDPEIERLLQERKVLPPDWRTRLRPRAVKKGRHRRAWLEFRGQDGSHFAIAVRVKRDDPADFSVGLCVLLSTGWFHLRRYNGLHKGGHRNRIEGNSMRAQHIHQATERYQARGWGEDAYATRASRYGDHRSALDCLVDDCNFVDAGTSAQLRLRFA